MTLDRWMRRLVKEIGGPLATKSPKTCKRGAKWAPKADAKSDEEAVGPETELKIGFSSLLSKRLARRKFVEKGVYVGGEELQQIRKRDSTSSHCH